MGIITDVFAATDKEVQTLDPEEYVGHLFPTLQSKGGAGTIELAELESLLTGRDADEIMGGFELVSAESEEGPWIIRVPTPLQDALVNLDEMGMEGVALRWGQGEQFRDYGWSNEEVIELLRGLWSLARQAREEGRNLFVLNAI